MSFDVQTFLSLIKSDVFFLWLLVHYEDLSPGFLLKFYDFSFYIYIFDPFCMLDEVGSPFLVLRVAPAPSVEQTVLSPLNDAVDLRQKAPGDIDVYFCTLHSIPLIYRPVLCQYHMSLML